MKEYTHVAGRHYLIMEGVRRTKAAELKGHKEIMAEVIREDGTGLGVGPVPIAALVSPKAAIRLRTHADQRRWQFALSGADGPSLPYPPIVLQLTQHRHGTSVEGISFDYGGDS